MIVVRMYAWGSGVKVRVQHHVTCCDQGDCHQPDEETTERAYPDYRAHPRDVWQCVTEVANRAMRSYSHRNLIAGLMSSDTLPFNDCQ